jgi:Ion channel
MGLCPRIQKSTAELLDKAALRRNRDPLVPLPRRCFDAFPANACSDPGVTAMAAPSAQAVALILPLMVSIMTTLGTILIHALAVIVIVHFIRRQHRVGRIGVGFRQDVAIVCITTLLASAAHLFEITIWALVFVFCGEFAQFAGAFYHSATNYTTLGYGDVVMTPSWRLLGPLEAADGMLMFGVSTAIIVSVVQLTLRTRFRDLPSF